MASPRRRGVLLPVLAGLSLLVSPAAVNAQDAPDRPVPSRFGTKDRIYTHVMYTEFRPTSSDQQLVSELTLFSTGGVGQFQAGVHVPSGALLTYLRLDYCDTNPTGDVYLLLQDCT
jgi:hypothetical protein